METTVVLEYYGELDLAAQDSNVLEEAGFHPLIQEVRLDDGGTEMPQGSRLELRVPMSETIHAAAILKEHWEARAAQIEDFDEST